MMEKTKETVSKVEEKFNITMKEVEKEKAEPTKREIGGRTQKYVGKKD